MTQCEYKCLWITLAVTEEEKPGNGKQSLFLQIQTLYIHICIWAHAHICPLLLTRQACSPDASAGIGICVPQREPQPLQHTGVSECHCPLKGTRALGGYGWLELGQGKYKMKLEHFVPERKEMLKRIMTQEAAWPNLGTNGRAGVRDGSPENTTGIHKPILA